MENNIIKTAQSGQSPFDSIRNIDEKGVEFWYATELLELLGYKTWKRIKETVERAILSCINSGQNTNPHFAKVVQMAQIGGSAAKREVLSNYKLSRLGCYLVAMNGDPRKSEIASAQTYFAIKTREAETAKPQTSAEMFLAAAQQMLELERRQLANERKTQELETIVRHHDAEIGRIFSP
ncbi:MAG: BRO family protein, partial [Xenococcaceae cyanobacterium]